MVSWQEVPAAYQQLTLGRAQFEQFVFDNGALLPIVANELTEAERTIDEHEASTDPITSGSIHGASVTPLLNLFKKMEAMGDEDD